MSSNYELSIRDYLNNKSDLKTVTYDLIKKWEKGLLNINEINSVVAFLYNSGFYRELIYCLTTNLLKNNYIPWHYFGEVLQHVEIKNKKHVFNIILEQSKQQKVYSDVILSKTFDEFDANAAKIRAYLRENKQKLYFQSKEDILSEIEILTSQRLYEEAKKKAELLNKKFPNDPQIINILNDIYEKYARNLINRRKISNEIYYTMQEYVKEEPEVLKCRIQITRYIFELIKNNKQDSLLIYNLAIMEFFFEDFDNALIILENINENTTTKDWLKIELLLLARRYIDALEFLSILEEKYGHDPETSFSVNYIRAQAFWGLQQVDDAVNLLKNILNVKPNYRAAHSLLLQWLGENV